MEPTRRNILTSLVGLLFGGGALVGSSALFASSTNAEADMRVVATSGRVELLVGPAADADVITKDSGELRVDFTSSTSGGIQSDATYQIGGIDVGTTEVQDPLNSDSVASDSGFPSPMGPNSNAGTAQGNAGILVQNNSSERLGVTVDFGPDDPSSVPPDARVLVVMHDKGSAAGDTDIHARLFDRDGIVSSSQTTEPYRPVFSGERLGVSLWVYTGNDTDQTQTQTPPDHDLSGELTFTADDEDDLTDIGSYP